MPSIIDVRTRSRKGFVDVTPLVAEAVGASGVPSGMLPLCVPSTAAGLTISGNAGPDVVADIIRALSQLVPRDLSLFRHREGSSAAHIKASPMGSAAQVLIGDGRLGLSTWQAVHFGEFDGPRARRLWVQLSPDR